MLQQPLLLTRCSYNINLCFLQLTTQEKDLAATIGLKGVLVDAVEVGVVIIVEEAREHLHQLVIIAFTRIFSKIQLKLTLYTNLSINIALLALIKTKIALLILIINIYIQITILYYKSLFTLSAFINTGFTNIKGDKTRIRPLFP